MAEGYRRATNKERLADGAAGGTGERVVREPRDPGHRPRGVSGANDAKGREGAASARPRAGDRTRGAFWLAALFASRGAPDPSATPRPRGRALWMVPPNDVPVIVCGSDLY